MDEGIIIKSTGKFYTIRNTQTNEVFSGIIRGKFKLQGLPLTNPVAVGDIVDYQLENDIAVIKHIHDRSNYVVRQSPRKKHFLHLMASNIDQVMLITTVVEPMLKQGFIDRLLLMTEPYHIPVIIVFNKWDLYSEEDKEVFFALRYIYEKIGYKVLFCSAATMEGLEQISDLLSSKLTLIAGQSGVGKSSIINQLVPGLDLKTDEISDYSGKGQHTTTFAEMHELGESTHIIDTPGIKTLGFNHLEAIDVAHNFREFFEFSSSCRFGDCIHINEPGCAVKKAIEEDEISILRYQNYVQILDEIENQNYWERIKEY